MSSSGLYIVNDSFYRHSTTSEMADLQFFSKKPFSPFSDIDLLQLQAISNQQTYQNVTDQNSPSLISSSSPSYQLETLSRTRKPSCTKWNKTVKTEESHQAFESHSYGGAENAAKFMQMSYSSNCFDGSNNKPGFYFQRSFDSLMESPSFQNQALSLSSPESSFLDGQMRRVSSTGDLQIRLLSRILINLLCNFRTNRAPRESSVMEEAAANFKTGRYSAEEWKERISEYRAKRPQRNFNKTSRGEYACRKTLADNRPRTRGRFARNDETGEILKAACSSTREEDEDELRFMNTFGATQFQYYGF
ncbi:hypothetical protein D8674_011814 [Pyrus ussuriensis x Pyrus communis]|uniref:CCT domain-containing protein n=1 Tax=Pyrus ussuriensis x Pyrus communis TaxID=2448454 RepID=A0A5N5FZW2_9ROSA|nr:hypothetical protein D8674_011814 [Pyrus ussuriensis x Pyrus communis]